MQAPPPPPPPARVAFVHNRAVWTMDASGNDRRQVVAKAGQPAWSPDGTRLAVARRREIITVNADGGDPRVIVRVSRGAIGTPAWSPDGTRIAYAALRLRRRGIDSALRTVAADGTDRRTVLAVQGRGRRAFDGIFGPQWSPDGSTLLYTHSHYAAPAEVRSVRVDGSGDRRLLARATGAVFAPDGARLLFGSYAGAKGETCGSDECYPNADVAVADADGTHRRTLLRTKTDESDPAWSADGSRITFSSARNVARTQYPSPEVYSMAADGSCLTWLTSGNRSSSAPRFSTGDATPASCATDRAPLLERPAGPRQAGALWLGESYDGALLSDQSQPGLFEYGDCSSFDPAACPPPFLLVGSSSCRDDRALRFDLRRLVAIRRIGTAVVGRLRGDGRALVFAGGRQTYVQASASTSRRLARFVVEGLRPIDGGELGPPRLPRRLIGLLPAHVRGLIAPC